MAEFYVEKTISEQDTRIIHNSKCGSLPADESLMYIGSYASVEAAQNIAGGYFPKVDCCPECTPAQA